MYSGKVIITKRYPGYFTAFLGLLAAVILLLVYAGCYTAFAGDSWRGESISSGLQSVIYVVCFILMGAMLVAYAVLPGLFRFYGDTYVGWYAVTGCAALAAFALETLEWSQSGSAGEVLRVFCTLSKLIVVVIDFGAVLHQCKPQPRLAVRCCGVAVVVLLTAGMVFAMIFAAGSILPTICIGGITMLVAAFFGMGVFGSGKTALIPACGNVVVLTGLLFSDLSVGVYSNAIHRLVLPVCLVIMLVCWAVMISAKQKFQIAALEKALAAEQASARTQAAFLASQIQPHFLYNTLTTIQELCYTDPTQAADTVVRFSNYLRQNIDFMEYKDKIPFSAEMEHIENYLDIQRARFGDAIRFVKDIEFDSFELPPLTVQPLIENAISHGIRKHTGQGTVTLWVRKVHGIVFISVNDNGVGFDVNTVHSRSLENIRCRIEGALDGEIHIDSRPQKGTTVTIRFPLKEAENHADRDRG